MTGHEIHELMHQLGADVESFAVLVGTTRATVYRWINAKGESPRMSLANLRNLALLRAWLKAWNAEQPHVERLLATVERGDPEGIYGRLLERPESANDVRQPKLGTSLMDVAALSDLLRSESEGLPREA